MRFDFLQKFFAYGTQSGVPSLKLLVHCQEYYLSRARGTHWIKGPPTPGGVRASPPSGPLKVSSRDGFESMRCTKSTQPA